MSKKRNGAVTLDVLLSLFPAYELVPSVPITLIKRTYSLFDEQQRKTLEHLYARTRSVKRLGVTAP